MRKEDDVTSGEFNLALATSKKFQEALRAKRMYEELSQGFMGLIRETLRLLDANGIEAKERRKAMRILQKAYALYSTRLELSPAVKRSQPSPDDEDGIRTCKGSTRAAH